MDRRHQVFVSSTFVDLKEERAAVVSAILQMESFPAGMELFPAVDDDSWTLIERVIDLSDYYLLVIGGRYGSVDPKTELSWTEKEYDLAVRLHKPVMALLHRNPDEIPFGKSEADAPMREKLAKFREKVKVNKHVKYWTGADDLAGKVALSFANMRQQYPAVGWIRGDAQASHAAVEQINKLRTELDEAKATLHRVRTQPPPGSERFAQGDDSLVVTVAWTAKMTDKGYGRSDRHETFTVETTWDQAFAAIGPVLLDEASQDAMRHKVDSWFALQAREDARERFDALVANGDDFVKFRLQKGVIADTTFDTVLIQLRALGFIEQSERKRSVNDKGRYWTLTSFGDERLTALRAIGRDPVEEPAT